MITLKIYKFHPSEVEKFIKIAACDIEDGYHYVTHDFYDGEEMGFLFEKTSLSDRCESLKSYLKGES